MFSIFTHILLMNKNVVYLPVYLMVSNRLISYDIYIYSLFLIFCPMIDHPYKYLLMIFQPP